MKIKRHGGEFIAQGTYGCVVKPNYKCDETDVSSKNKISKLFATESNMNEEIKENNNLTKIDKENKYFYKIYKGCKFDKKLNMQ